MNPQPPSALITGAASGIGRAVAELLWTRHGFSLCLFDVSAPALADLKASLEASQSSPSSPSSSSSSPSPKHQRCVCVVGDVRDGDAQRRAVDAAVALGGGGRLRASVVNAGVGEAGDFLSAPDDADARRVVDIDLTAALAGIRLAAQAMGAATGGAGAAAPGGAATSGGGGGGAIVCVASAAGFFPVPASPVYAAAKAGLAHACRSLAPRLAARGVRLTAVCPQYIDTPLVAELMGRGKGAARAMMGPLYGAPLLTPAAAAEVIVSVLAPLSPEEVAGGKRAMGEAVGEQAGGGGGGRGGEGGGGGGEGGEGSGVLLLLQDGRVLDPFRRRQQRRPTDKPQQQRQRPPPPPPAAAALLPPLPGAPLSSAPLPPLLRFSPSACRAFALQSLRSLPQTYRRVVVRELGTDFRRATELRSAPLPPLLSGLGAGDVLVRRVFAGANASDVNYTGGRYHGSRAAALGALPYDAGFESVGVVVAVGGGEGGGGGGGTSGHGGPGGGPWGRDVLIPSPPLLPSFSSPPTPRCVPTSGHGGYGGGHGGRASSAPSAPSSPSSPSPPPPPPLAVGDAVATMDGGFSEWAAVPARRCLRVPSPTPEAVALLTSGMTASIALERAAGVRLPAGFGFPGPCFGGSGAGAGSGGADSGGAPVVAVAGDAASSSSSFPRVAIVTAAAGGTGQFAVQLLKRAGGWRVVATCSGGPRGDKAALLRALGADAVVDYRAAAADAAGGGLRGALARACAEVRAGGGGEGGGEEGGGKEDGGGLSEEGSVEGSPNKGGGGGAGGGPKNKGGGGAAAGRGADLVYESVGGDTFDACVDVLADRGVLVIIGMMDSYASGWKPRQRAGLPEKLLWKSAAVSGFFLLRHAALWAPHLAALCRMAGAGALRVAVDDGREGGGGGGGGRSRASAFVGVEAVADAVERLQGGRSSGKVVVQLSRELPEEEGAEGGGTGGARAAAAGRRRSRL